MCWKKAIVLVFCISLLSLGGCGGLDAPDAPGKPDKVYHVSAARPSMEETKLERLQEKEKRLLLELSVEDEAIPESERDRLLLDMVYAYESFLAQNPQSELGFVLYGKFLRDIGMNKMANVQFVQANKLNPNIAVVKQQIGNYLAEEGLFELALPYFLAAIELEPRIALYHYQLGELLYTYYEAYLSKGVYDRHTLDEQMLAAFRRAAELQSSERTYLYRYAEAFYDVQEPNWDYALAVWEHLMKGAQSDREADIIRLQRARVHLLRGESEAARTLLAEVNQPALEASRQSLLAQLP